MGRDAAACQDGGSGTGGDAVTIDALCLSATGLPDLLSRWIGEPRELSYYLRRDRVWRHHVYRLRLPPGWMASGCRIVAIPGGRLLMRLHALGRWWPALPWPHSHTHE